MSTLHSYTLLESIVYKLQEKGAIVDPCVVDDLITCIKTTKKVEYNKILKETKDIPGFEGTLEALDELTIIK